MEIIKLTTTHSYGAWNKAELKPKNGNTKTNFNEK